ncbi:MAG TPA: glucose-1-phosphate adenylyltransferase family protein [Thermomicrobiales bacterium]|jgi:glucose-1-phosphate adenylyltransferase
MARPRVLALILAGGEGGRLELLTEYRAKPAVPFAGTYRLIDFVLSNCANSRLDDVWVLAQYHPHALNDHLANGRPWDLDRTFGGLKVLQPYLGSAEGGWYQGNADAIYRQSQSIRDFAPDLVLVLSADHVYHLDYRAVIDQHQHTGATATIVTTRVPRERAGQHGVVGVDEDGRVTAFAYKPDEPQSDLIATEVFLYDAATLLDTLDALIDEARGAADGDGADTDEASDATDEDGSDTEGDKPALRDFGHELLPRLVEAGGVREYRLDGYWRDVGTIASYWAAHRELLADDRALPLDDPGWPLRTFAPQRPAARLAPRARIASSLLAPGSLIAGDVSGAILGPGVIVEEGATVRDAIILEGARIARGATVERAIIDAGATIGEGATVGAPHPDAADADAADADGVVLIGIGAVVAPQATIRAGDRVTPASG